MHWELVLPSNLEFEVFILDYKTYMDQIHVTRFLRNWHPKRTRTTHLQPILDILGEGFLVHPARSGVPPLVASLGAGDRHSDRHHLSFQTLPRDGVVQAFLTSGPKRKPKRPGNIPASNTQIKYDSADVAHCFERILMLHDGSDLFRFFWNIFFGLFYQLLVAAASCPAAILADSQAA